MGADQFIKKVNSGDDIFDHLTSNAFNAFVDAANANKGGNLNQQGGPLQYEDSPNVIEFRNDSGSVRARYDILALTGVTFTPTTNLSSFQAQPLFTGELPTLANTGKFAILLDPVGTHSTNKYGKAAISGTWVTKLLINHASHQYADIADGTARLTSNWYGSAKILYKESGTGEKWGVVRLGDSFWGPIKAVADAAITAGSSGTVSVYHNGSDSGSNATAHLNWMHGGVDVVSGAELLMSWFQDEQKLIITNASC